MSVLIFITLTHSNEPVVCRLSVIFQTVPQPQLSALKSVLAFAIPLWKPSQHLTSSKSQQAQKATRRWLAFTRCTHH
jgi:hypothetical protein